MANYRHCATYGSLAYDLDALAREKQLDEAKQEYETAKANALA